MMPSKVSSVRIIPPLVGDGLNMGDALNGCKFRIKFLFQGYRNHRNVGIVVVVVRNLDMPIESGHLFADLILQPRPPWQMEMSIMTSPMATAAIAIFIIGAEMLTLSPAPLIRRLAKKYSKFKRRHFYDDSYSKVFQGSKVRFSFCFWWWPPAVTPTNR